MKQSLCVGAYWVSSLALGARRDIRTARKAKVLEVECTTFVTLQLQPEVHRDVSGVEKVFRLVVSAGCALSVAPRVRQNCLAAGALASVSGPALVVLKDTVA